MRERLAKPAQPRFRQYALLPSQEVHGQTDKEQKSHKAARGVTGKTEDECPGPISSAGTDSEPKRLSRLEPDLVKDLPDAKLLECPRYQVLGKSGTRMQS